METRLEKSKKISRKMSKKRQNGKAKKNSTKKKIGALKKPVEKMRAAVKN